MGGMWVDPNGFPGPRSGGLRTREGPFGDAAGLISILVVLVALIVVPLVVAAILD